MRQTEDRGQYAEYEKNLQSPGRQGYWRARKLKADTRASISCDVRSLEESRTDTFFEDFWNGSLTSSLSAHQYLVPAH